MPSRKAQEGYFYRVLLLKIQQKIHMYWGNNSSLSGTLTLTFWPGKILISVSGGFRIKSGIELNMSEFPKVCFVTLIRFCDLDLNNFILVFNSDTIWNKTLNQFSISAASWAQGHRLLLKPLPVVRGQREGDALDKWLIYQGHTETNRLRIVSTHTHLQFPTCLTKPDLLLFTELLSQTVV